METVGTSHPYWGRSVSVCVCLNSCPQWAAPLDTSKCNNIGQYIMFSLAIEPTNSYDLQVSFGTSPDERECSISMADAKDKGRQAPLLTPPWKSIFRNTLGHMWDHLGRCLGHVKFEIKTTKTGGDAKIVPVASDMQECNAADSPNSATHFSLYTHCIDAPRQSDAPTNLLKAQWCQDTIANQTTRLPHDGGSDQTQLSRERSFDRAGRHWINVSKA